LSSDKTGLLSEFPQRYKAMESVLVERLSEEGIWTDPARKSEILDALAAVRTLRTKAAVPFLLTHIDYRPAYSLKELAGLETSMKPLEARYPAFAALQDVGLPAVQGLLDEMKRIDPSPPVPTDPRELAIQKVLSEEKKQRFRLLAFCLIGIYGEKNEGRELARVRIKLEAEKSSGQAREFLMKALDHPVLKIKDYTETAPGAGANGDSEIAAMRDRRHLVGTLGPQAVQMDLTIQGERAWGTYFEEAAGIAFDLSDGRLQPDGTLMLKQRQGTDPPTGTFRGVWRPAEGRYAGEWTSADGARRLPFALAVVADYAVLRAEETLNRPYPRPLTVEAAYPLLGSGAAEAVNNMVRRTVGEFCSKFMRDEMQQAPHDSPISEQSLSVAYNLVYYAPDLVSVLGQHWDYTGGAHGNGGYQTLNLAIREGKVTGLRLADLFRPGSDYLRRLSDRCVDLLHRAEASDVVAGRKVAFSEPDLGAFTIGPKGITFYFAPYEVGCFAEGAYEVTVPYADVAPVIAPQGPLGRFLTPAGGP
jgi:hypothetical protein